MIGELVQFGVVMFVVMLGFAVSFHALFSNVDTFGQTFLTLFKSMLGEVGFFDEFQGDDFNEYEDVATALFVIYLVVIAIVLLNLLIAVLSTSHAKIQEKAELEFKATQLSLEGLEKHACCSYSIRYHEMLNDRPGGMSAGGLQDCLEDPMGDPEVRQDEKSRPTTVEHIKLLRDRMEKAMEANLGTRLENVEREVETVEHRLSERLSKFESVVAESQENLDRKLDRVLVAMQKLAT
eukprot:g10772.t1